MEFLEFFLKYLEPDFQIGYIFNFFSMGTILFIIMIVFGFVFLILSKRKMKSNLKFFKNSKIISLDSFIQNVLYDKKLATTPQNIHLEKKVIL